MKRRNPDPRSSKELADEQHFLLSTNSFAWVIKADELLEAFEIITKEDKKTLRAPPQLSGITYMLAGFAVEVLIKAILIQAGKGIGSDGKFALRSHDLLDLAGKAHLTLTDEDCQLLERLQEYLVWAGRYPVATKSEALQPRTLPNGGFAPVTAHWGGEDLTAIRTFVTQLKTMLPNIRYPE